MKNSIGEAKAVAGVISVPFYRSPAMIKMQVGQDHICNVIRRHSYSSQGFFEAVVPVQVIIRKEFFTLLVAYPAVNKNFMHALFDKQAAHAPVTEVILIAGIQFAPHHLWHYAKHRAPVELEITGIYDVEFHCRQHSNVKSEK